MQAFFLAMALTILLASLAALYRVIQGPVIFDRIVGANVIGTKTIAVVLLTGFLFERVEFFIDIAFVYALINFIGTLALSKYFEQKGAQQRRPTP
jgi:multicomponent Na+:H+ antiporter subunit F